MKGTIVLVLMFALLAISYSQERQMPERRNFEGFGRRVKREPSEKDLFLKEAVEFGVEEYEEKFGESPGALINIERQLVGGFQYILTFQPKSPTN